MNFVFSLGQFVSSDLNTLKENLTELYATYGHYEITGDMIWAFLERVDEVTKKTHLYELRMGAPLFDFWKNTIQVQFPINGVDVSEDSECFNKFKTVWNSMCEIKENALRRMSDFIGYLEDHPDTTFILISHTNHAHFENIKEQIEANFGTRFPWNQIKFITSMDSQAENHVDTLHYGFKHQLISINKSEDEIISCLNTISNEILSQYVDRYSSITLPKDFDFRQFEEALPNTASLTYR